MKTYKKGISLIVLVITVIVLAILATVLTLTLANTNIIGKANSAVNANNKAARKEAAQLAYASWMSDYYENKTTTTPTEYVREYLSNQNIQSSDIVVRDNGEILVGVPELPEGFKVGDYVVYEYNTATYTTPTGAGRVNTTTQTFSSAAGGNVELNVWQVLSIDDYVVELIPVLPSDTEGLVLYGQEGYLNGPTVLNDMCKTLYSSEYGTARSIDIEDIYKYYEYDGTRRYLDANGTEVKIAASETGLETIGQIMAANNADVNSLGTVIPGQTNGNLANLKYRYPYGNYDTPGFDILSNNGSTAQMRVYGALIDNAYTTFWLASTTELLRINKNTVTYRHFMAQKTGDILLQIGSRNLCSSKGDIETDVLETSYAVRPIVEINPMVQFSDTENGTVTFRTNHSTVTTDAWTIVGIVE